MILNASGRTDIPAFYSDWFLNRIDAGWFLSRNPRYPRSVRRYRLDPSAVDVLLMCSKNWGPMLPHVKPLLRRFRLVFHGTVTAYGKDVEPNVPPVDEAAECLAELGALAGPQRVAWRYDPIAIWGPYGVREHLAAFARIAARLEGRAGRCIFSFLEMYAKVRRNFPGARAVLPEEMEALAAGMAKIAARHGMLLQTCGTDADFQRFGVLRSGCATAKRLEEATGCALKDRGRKGGERAGCMCMDWRDMGAYDTCPHGCRYCYANSNHDLARRRWRAYDPASPMLCDSIGPEDDVRDGRMESLRVLQQGTLF